MSTIDQHTLNTLEYPKLMAAIAGKCLTPYGIERVEALEPSTETAVINRRLDEHDEMRELVQFGAAFPLSRQEDVREVLSRSRVKGGCLEAMEIMHIGMLLAESSALTKYDPESRESHPIIDEYLSGLRLFPDLQQRISRTFDDKGEVQDNATPELKRIRRELGDSRRRIISQLERTVSGQSRQAGRQDDVVTQRNGRYVITVPSGQFQTNMGILHDRSQSGATLYVETSGTIELNNKINSLMQDEKQEVHRILVGLTREIAEHSAALMENIRIIGELDRMHAVAMFAAEVRALRPQIVGESTLSLIDARHPLLIRQLGDPTKVVPTTLSLDDDRRVLLITGPNTGGKTITLKTVGLLALMAQTGLLIPAAEKSVVGTFTKVFADIGDEQSIELSLSTFSSHIRNIIKGLTAADNRTLLLFDEIGAGTDPKEGGALAQAIIVHSLKSNCRMMATTHYSELKTLAMEYPEIENASLEFDRKTLAPTYRLQIGLPGSSYAIEIAERLGMPQSICGEAAQIVGTGEKSLTELISALETELAQVRKDKAELGERLEKTKDLEKYYRTQSEKLRKDVETEKERALSETLKYVEDTRAETERLVAEIRESQASKESLKKFHHSIRERSEKLSDEQAKLKEKPKEVRHDVFEPGDKVTVISFNKTGEIEELIGRDRARVRIGAISTTVELRNLKKEASADGSSPRRATVHTGTKHEIESVESPEVHLRGLTVEEAVEKLEQYLGRAIVAGLGQVYVVHGKGTGALRRSLSEYLHGHPDVESIRLGNWNEGGAGVTIVKLKS